MLSLAWSYARNHIPLTAYPYKGEAVNCPVCGSANHGSVAQWDRRMKCLPTALCDDCGLFFTNPMPTDAELQAYYRDIYRFDYQLSLFKPKRSHVRVKRKEANVRFSTMARYLPDRAVRFLDFGCGSGELVKRFAEAGHDAHGFEPGARFAIFGNNAIHDGTQHIDAARWEDLVYPAGSFDAVSLLHVLEHLRNPVAALARIREWLADDGIVYIEVPDMQAYELKGTGHFHFAHVLGFSRANFIHAAEKAGFALMTELGATSMIFRKRDKDAALTITAAQLQATAVRNRAEYSRRPTLMDHLRYHRRRLMRAIGANKNNSIAASAVLTMALGCSEV